MIARGHRKSPCAALRVVIAFDEATFKQVRQRAVADRTSFNQAALLLIEFGLETANAN